MERRHLTVRAIAYKEGDVWVAQALEYDIGAQAADLTTLKRRFELSLAVELEESLRRSDVPFGGIDPAPEYFHKMWDSQQAGEFSASGSTKPRSDISALVDYEMKLAA